MKKLNIFQNRPKATKIDIEAYLERIGLSHKPASLEYLKKLQKAHLLHIPFENLDIHYKNKITLDYQKIFDKVITRRRGGFCYELNGLFYHLLYHLGFDCYIISGQVWSHKKEAFGRPFDHMAIVVKLKDELWLVDVGFGDGQIAPLKITVGELQMDYTQYWKIETDPDENLILRHSSTGSYLENRIKFTLEERELIQFLEMCEYHQSSPDSPFTQKKLATILTQDGRVTLTDRKLKIKSLGETEEKPILHEDDFLSKLEHHFGITFQQLIPKQE
ncbi:N-hydroxyarylamine O-acetyltransferase [Ekhidna lutea]|uniref:N-hydroxyarylamine O-acetyltransferase n=1 Tax=Ekhidna lutea TaxID=447679 RepID=A0A239ELR4_EKHLU|nr:arylamine N-acetyltransferase [Ekhidna lutea]SNS45720.1 N-hydroxyarylamine O-acetyltransferase [Ekhidna lutea]